MASPHPIGMQDEPPGTPPRVANVPKNLKPYFLGLLFKGERWNETEGAEAGDLVPRQLAFLREQIESGRYIVAGPALGGGELVGVSLIEARSLEEAERSAAQDPGVAAGRLRLEVHPVLLPSLPVVTVLF